jgi:hypothetical protein
MIRFIAALLAGGCLLGSSPALAQPAEPDAASPARITVERDGDMFTISPTYALPDTAGADTTALRYELTVERTGASTSRSRQGGMFTPAPGRADTLSTVRVNAQSGDRLHLRLLLHRDDQLVTEITRTAEIAPPE